jgi:hypothetical protein
MVRVAPAGDTWLGSDLTTADLNRIVTIFTT